MRVEEERNLKRLENSTPSRICGIIGPEMGRAHLVLGWS
jgi:hypothetical protein